MGNLGIHEGGKRMRDSEREERATKWDAHMYTCNFYIRERKVGSRFLEKAPRLTIETNFFGNNCRSLRPTPLTWRFPLFHGRGTAHVN